MNPVFLDEADVRATLDMPTALGLIETAASAIAGGSAINAPRQRVRAGGAMLQVLPAALKGRVGFKSYTVGPRGATFWVTLFAPDGAMIAIIEANRLGQIRTGAASGVATRYMARKDARTLGTIGTGYQAATQIEAVCLVRAIERVRVFGRDTQRLTTFCDDLSQQLGRLIEPAASAEAAISDADVVVTMTSSAQPVFAGGSLRLGTHVNAAGSNRATAQEIDIQTVRRAAVVAVEDLAQARTESGDLCYAVEAGAFAWSDAVLISDIVAGRATGRRTDDEITLFESLGVGIWDVAAASHVYDTCLQARRGRSLPFAG